RLLRQTVRQTQDENGMHGKGRFTASLIVAGQIKGMEPRLFLIYPEGNFIEASWDTPFFQVGETKYGRPILIRGYDRKMSFEDAVKLLMVSFDSTLKANLSVGLPLDLMVIERDRFEPHHVKRIEHGDPYFDAISNSWSDALRSAFHSLPDYSLEPQADWASGGGGLAPPASAANARPCRSRACPTWRTLPPRTGWCSRWAPRCCSAAGTGSPTANGWRPWLGKSPKPQRVGSRLSWSALARSRWAQRSSDWPRAGAGRWPMRRRLQREGRSRWRACGASCWANLASLPRSCC